MTDLTRLAANNARRWRAAKITRGSEFASVAKRLVAAKSRYQVVAKQTGVPWFVIAVIHERESSQNFSRSLAQGDPWNRVSVHVPRGRGPFNSWEEAAIDALVVCAPHASRWKDWSPGGAMTLLEQYNGLGYASRSIPSPYVWSGTDQYGSGKYVADGVFDPDAVDRQLGCAGLILAMQKLDPSIAFAGETPGQAPPPPDIEPDDGKPAPKSATKSKITWLAWLMGLFGGGGSLATDNPLINKVLGSDELADKITHLITQPRFLIFVALLLGASAITFFYWRDHGLGRGDSNV